MLPYFKRYSIYVCVIAVAPPLIYSTAYPLLTGNLAASSLGGTVVMFILFVAGLLIGFGVFERRAQAKADAWVALYNDDCDPEGFVREGAPLASAIKEPYNQTASWYMGYYAQAQLDLGNVQDAKEVLSAMADGVSKAKKPFDKVGIMVNMVPLAEKLEGVSYAFALAGEGIAACDACRASDVGQYREFLVMQQTIFEARMSSDAEMMLKLDDSVWQSSRFPKRIRVEYAWDAASVNFRELLPESEKRALEYVVANGGKLALVVKAKDRLEDLRVC